MTRLEKIERGFEVANRRGRPSPPLMDLEFVVTELQAERKRREAAEKVVEAAEGICKHYSAEPACRMIAAYREEYPDG